MEHNQEERTLALAGIYQSVILVKEVANTGNVSDAHLASILETLFRFDANNVMDVYGDVTTIKKGLITLHEQLSGDKRNIDMEITRYVINILQLEKILRKSPHLMNKLATELENSKSKVEYFHISHDNVIASLADIYQQIISPIGPKIMVQGSHTYLSQTNNANKVRALLFAGVRSAVLWRQCGGSRWQLLLSRKKYIDSAATLLKNL
ncbi:MAG: high frequency lysogenization protein HflD [Gammaproteobacteria bacterium]|nr:high frequency lysogenization protein HflD [Gammaproteobacteria bacterium]